jgi:hypothetical protein
LHMPNSPFLVFREKLSIHTSNIIPCQNFFLSRPFFKLSYQTTTPYKMNIKINVINGTLCVLYSFHCEFLTVMIFVWKISP